MNVNEPSRPDPDALLAEAKRQGRGRLKVFLGMAPGVGKTFEMLAQASRRREEGDEVLVGVVETHGRKETEAWLKDLEIIPERSAPALIKGKRSGLVSRELSQRRRNSRPAD